MKTLLSISSRAPIYFANKPLPQCTKDDCKLLSQTEINQIMSKHRNLDFTWDSDVLIPDTWQLTEADHEKICALKSKIIAEEQLVVCYIDKQVGYCVYARTVIKKGSILFYSGEVKPYNNEKLIYGMDAKNNNVQDAEKNGNFTSLFQDLYDTAVPLTDFPFAVACNNFEAKLLQLSCGSVVYLEAAVDILPNTQCGVSYGRKYWEIISFCKQIQKQYFTTRGEIIPKMYADFLRLKTLTTDDVENIKKGKPIISSLAQIET